jgi:hypothetical protein
MATIQQLSSIDNISSGDQIPVFSVSNGDARKLSIGSLLSFFQKTFASPNVATNVFVPVEGFDVNVPTPVASQQWIVLQPTSNLSAGRVILPLNTITPDGTEVLITCTRNVNTFTLFVNGALTAYGSPTTIVANEAHRFRYIQSTNSWYKIV